MDLPSKVRALLWVLWSSSVLHSCHGVLPPAKVTFKDADVGAGTAGGLVEIHPPGEDVDHYDVYWGDVSGPFDGEQPFGSVDGSASSSGTGHAPECDGDSCDVINIEANNAGGFVVSRGSMGYHEYETAVVDLRGPGRLTFTHFDIEDNYDFVFLPVGPPLTGMRQVPFAVELGPELEQYNLEWVSGSIVTGTGWEATWEPSSPAYLWLPLGSVQIPSGATHVYAVSVDGSGAKSESTSTEFTDRKRLVPPTSVTFTDTADVIGLIAGTFSIMPGTQGTFCAPVTQTSCLNFSFMPGYASPLVSCSDPKPTQCMDANRTWHECSTNCNFVYDTSVQSFKVYFGSDDHTRLRTCFASIIGITYEDDECRVGWQVDGRFERIGVNDFALGRYAAHFGDLDYVFGGVWLTHPPKGMTVMAYISPDRDVEGPAPVVYFGNTNATASTALAIVVTSDAEFLCVIWLEGAGHACTASGVQITIGTFQHVACTVDGGTVRPFYNGAPAGVCTVDMPNFDSGAAQELYLAPLVGNGWSKFVGAIDEVFVHDAPLSGDDIRVFRGEPLVEATNSGGVITISLDARSVPRIATHFLAYSLADDMSTLIGASPMATPVNDVGTPTGKARSVRFRDNNTASGSVGGMGAIRRAIDERDVRRYVVYWGSDATTKLAGKSAITDVSVDDIDQNAARRLAWSHTRRSGRTLQGGPVTWISVDGYVAPDELSFNMVNTAIPTGATHLLVFAAWGTQEAENGVGVQLIDWAPPAAIPAAVTFEDTDDTAMYVSGTLTITRAASETSVTSYEVYWVDSQGVRGPRFASVAATGSARYLVQVQSYPWPYGAYGLVAYAAGVRGVSIQGVMSAQITDLARPASAPGVVAYMDQDPNAGGVEGELVIMRAMDESSIGGYGIWVASSSGIYGAHGGEVVTPLVWVPIGGGVATVILELYDSYGDGWSGNYYTITDVNSGDVLATGTMVYGDYQSDTLNIPGGRLISITVGGGTWLSEVSWALFACVGGGGVCQDTSLGATDSFGYTCADYEGYSESCGAYDDSDFTAGDMCCACFGACHDTSEGATDASGYACADYAGYEQECGGFDDADFSANNMCCECQGCVDSAYGATDTWGDGCAYYSDNPEDCTGGYSDDQDFTAADMCCACQNSCQDTNSGAQDTDGDNCSYYNAFPQDCTGAWDDQDFTAAQMCCGCQNSCQDTNDGAEDSGDTGCEYYYWYPDDCGAYDDDDFTSDDMCCVCGGGAEGRRLQGQAVRASRFGGVVLERRRTGQTIRPSRLVGVFPARKQRSHVVRTSFRGGVVFERKRRSERQQQGHMVRHRAMEQRRHASNNRRLGARLFGIRRLQSSLVFRHVGQPTRKSLGRSGTPKQASAMALRRRRFKELQRSQTGCSHLASGQADDVVSAQIPAGASSGNNAEAPDNVEVLFTQDRIKVNFVGSNLTILREGVLLGVFTVSSKDACSVASETDLFQNMLGECSLDVFQSAVIADWVPPTALPTGATFQDANSDARVLDGTLSWSTPSGVNGIDHYVLRWGAGFTQGCQQQNFTYNGMNCQQLVEAEYCTPFGAVGSGFPAGSDFAASGMADECCTCGGGSSANALTRTVEPGARIEFYQSWEAQPSGDLDAMAPISTGIVSTIGLASVLDAGFMQLDTFAVRWKGVLDVRHGGPYYFFTHDQLLVEFPDAQQFDGGAVLSKGLNVFQFTLYHMLGEPIDMFLLYNGPDTMGLWASFVPGVLFHDVDVPVIGTLPKNSVTLVMANASMPKGADCILIYAAAADDDETRVGRRVARRDYIKSHISVIDALDSSPEADVDAFISFTIDLADVAEVYGAFPSKTDNKRIARSAPFATTDAFSAHETSPVVWIEDLPGKLAVEGGTAVVIVAGRFLNGSVDWEATGAVAPSIQNHQLYAANGHVLTKLEFNATNDANNQISGDFVVEFTSTASADALTHFDVYFGRSQGNMFIDYEHVGFGFVRFMLPSTPSTIQDALDSVNNGLSPQRLQLIQTSSLLWTSGGLDTFWRASGRYAVTTPGLYLFCLSSQDGSQLYVGSALAINNDGVHPVRAASKLVWLDQGLVDISFQGFFAASRGGEVEFAQLTIAGPDTGYQRTPLDPNRMFSGTSPSAAWKRVVTMQVSSNAASARLVNIDVPQEATHFIVVPMDTLDAAQRTLRSRWSPLHIEDAHWTTPLSMQFYDENFVCNAIQGVIKVIMDPNDDNSNHFNLYFGSDENTRLPNISTRRMAGDVVKKRSVSNHEKSQFPAVLRHAGDAHTAYANHPFGVQSASDGARWQSGRYDDYLWCAYFSCSVIDVQEDGVKWSVSRGAYGNDELSVINIGRPGSVVFTKYDVEDGYDFVSVSIGCVDTDHGATDVDGDGCYYYDYEPADCTGAWNDDDFSAQSMCCSCRGFSFEDYIDRPEPFVVPPAGGRIRWTSDFSMVKQGWTFEYSVPDGSYVPIEDIVIIHSAYIGSVSAWGPNPRELMIRNMEVPEGATHILAYPSTTTIEGPIPLGLLLNDYCVPPSWPIAVSLSDTDQHLHRLSGTVWMTPAEDESDVTAYEAYIGTSERERLKVNGENVRLGSVAKDGSGAPLEIAFSGVDVPPELFGQLYVLGFSTMGDGSESMFWASAHIVDNGITSAVATDLDFEDVNPLPGVIAGNLTFNRASHDGDPVDLYKVYFGAHGVKVGGSIGELDGETQQGQPTCGRKGSDDTPIQGASGQRAATDVKPKIVNGQDTTRCEYPWQVSLRAQAYGWDWHFCGGTLISPTWVVTASHCVEGTTGPMRIVAGAWDFRDTSGDQMVNVAEIIMHEGYDTNTMVNDIALLRLATPLQQSECVDFACLPTQDVFDTQACVITGWGTLSSGGSTPDILQEAEVRIVGDAECAAAYGSEYHAHEMVCAQGQSPTGITDACQGDSGGPLVCMNEFGGYALQGATSWGYGCADANYPGIWSRVNTYIEWITGHTGENLSPSRPLNVGLVDLVVPQGAMELLVVASYAGIESKFVNLVRVYDWDPPAAIATPMGAVFVDEDYTRGEIGGVVTIQCAQDESDLESYVIVGEYPSMSVLLGQAAACKDSSVAGATEVFAFIWALSQELGSIVVHAYKNSGGMGVQSVNIIFTDTSDMHVPGGINFDDQDVRGGVVGGTIELQGAAEVSVSGGTLTGYAIYWGDKTQHCAKLSSNSSRLATVNIGQQVSCTGPSCNVVELSRVQALDGDVWTFSRSGFEANEFAIISVHGPGMFLIESRRLGNGASLTIAGTSVNDYPMAFEVGAGLTMLRWTTTAGSNTYLGWSLQYFPDKIRAYLVDLPNGTALPDKADLIAFAIYQQSELLGCATSPPLFDYIPPEEVAASATISDEDPRRGRIAGTMEITCVVNGSAATEFFMVYAGDAQGNVYSQRHYKVAAPAVGQSTGVDVEFTLTQNETHAVIFAGSSGGKWLQPLLVPFNDYWPPQVPPAGADFTDANPVNDTVGGTVFIRKGPADARRTHFKLYWADSEGRRIAFVGNASDIKPNVTGISRDRMVVQPNMQAGGWSLGRGMDGYNNNEEAVITINGPGTLKFTGLDIESGYDFVRVLGQTFTGSSIPIDPQTGLPLVMSVPSGGQQIRWTSDSSTTLRGFTMHWNPADTTLLDIRDATPQGTHLLVVSAGDGGEMNQGELVEASDWAPPMGSPTSAQFTDTDLRVGAIGGLVTVGRATDESGVDRYVLYWAQASGPFMDNNKIVEGTLSAASTTQANVFLTVPVGTYIPARVTQLSVHAAGAKGVSVNGIAIPLQDATGLSLSRTMVREAIAVGQNRSVPVTITNSHIQDVEIEASVQFVQEAAANSPMTSRIVQSEPTSSITSNPKVKSTPAKPEAAPNRCVFKWKASDMSKGRRLAAERRLQTNYNVKAYKQYRRTGLAVAEIEDSDIDNACHALNTDPLVAFAHPDYIMRVHWVQPKLSHPKFKGGGAAKGFHPPPLNKITWAGEAAGEEDRSLPPLNFTLPTFTTRAQLEQKIASSRLHHSETGIHTPALDAQCVLKEQCTKSATPMARPTDYTVPQDPDFEQQWGMDDIDAVGAWASYAGMRNDYVVALIDTGTQIDHPDLAGQIWTNLGEIPGNGIDDDGNGYIDDVHGYNFHDDSADVAAGDHMHGTHCAGIIAMRRGNGEGGAGVAERAKIMVLRALDGEEGGRTSSIIEALEYAIVMGAKISSNSYGGGPESAGMRAVLQAAAEADHLFVVAAGNDAVNNDESLTYPCSYDHENVFCVASTYRNPNNGMTSLSTFSNYGAQTVDIGAPGSSIFSTVPSAGYEFLSGTSMATPFVSGAAVVIRELSPQMPAIEVKTLLMNAGTPTVALEGRTVSGTRLNLTRAVQFTLEKAWISLSAGQITAKSSSSSDLVLDLVGSQVPMGQYTATLMLRAGTWSKTVPVVAIFHSYEAAPTEGAAGVQFTDTDPQLGKLGGIVDIERAAAEYEANHIYEYRLYWGSSGTDKLENEPFELLSSAARFRDEFAEFQSSLWLPASEGHKFGSGFVRFYDDFAASHFVYKRPMTPPFQLAARIRSAGGDFAPMALMILDIGGDPSQPISYWSVPKGVRIIKAPTFKVIVLPSGISRSIRCPCFAEQWTTLEVKVEREVVTFSDAACDDLIVELPQALTGSQQIVIGAQCSNDECIGSDFDYFEAIGGADLEYTLPQGTVPAEGATHLLVAAANPLGEHEPAVSVELQDLYRPPLPVKAARPTQVQGMLPSASTVLVSWTTGALNDCAFAGTTVQFRQEGSDQWSVPVGCNNLPVTAYMCTASRLTARTKYYFRVQTICNNIVANSEFSSQSPGTDTTSRADSSARLFSVMRQDFNVDSDFETMSRDPSLPSGLQSNLAAAYGVSIEEVKVTIMEIVGGTSSWHLSSPASRIAVYITGSPAELEGLSAASADVTSVVSSTISKSLGMQVTVTAGEKSFALPAYEPKAVIAVVADAEAHSVKIKWAAQSFNDCEFTAFKVSAIPDGNIEGAFVPTGCLALTSLAASSCNATGLPTGSTFRFGVTVICRDRTLDSGMSALSAEVFPRSAKAALDVPQMASATCGFVADASGSSTVSGGSLVYTWSCLPAATCASVFTGVGSVSSVNIAPSSLPLGNYTIIVQVRQSAASVATAASVSRTVTVTEEAVLGVVVAAEPWKSSGRVSTQATKLEVKADVQNSAACPVPTAWAWSWVLIDDMGSLVANLGATVTPVVTATRNVYNVASLYELPSNALGAGRTYKCLLTRWDNQVALASFIASPSGALEDSEAAVAKTVAFLADTPPTNGVVTVEPASGEAIRTKFVVRTDKWADEQKTQLQYSFYYFPILDSALTAPAIEWNDKASALYWKAMGGVLLRGWFSSRETSSFSLKQGSFFVAVRAKDVAGGVGMAKIIGPLVNQIADLTDAEVDNLLAEALVAGSAMDVLHVVSGLGGTATSGGGNNAGKLLNALSSVSQAMDMTPDNVQMTAAALDSVVAGGGVQLNQVGQAADVMAAMVNNLVSGGDSISQETGEALLGTVLSLSSAVRSVADDGDEDVTAVADRATVGLVAAIASGMLNSLADGESMAISAQSMDGSDLVLSASKASGEELFTMSGLNIDAAAIKAVLSDVNTNSNRRLQACGTVSIQLAQFVNANPYGGILAPEIGLNEFVPENASVTIVSVELCGTSVAGVGTPISLQFTVPPVPKGVGPFTIVCAKYDADTKSWVTDGVTTGTVGEHELTCSSADASGTYVALQAPQLSKLGRPEQEASAAAKVVFGMFAPMLMSVIAVWAP